MRRWWPLFVFFAVGVAWAQPCPQYGASHAVVIGVNDSGPGNAPLQAAEQDAERMALALKARGFQVTTLVGAQASRAAVIKLLSATLPSALKPEDRVVVYFAGHGQTVGDASPMGYLMPHGGDPTVPATGISMQDLVGWMGNYPARHKLLLVDACYSGLALTRSIQRADTSPAACGHLDVPVLALMVAGRKDEVAREDARGGYFTTALVAALRYGPPSLDPDGDGAFTHTDLAAYVEREVLRRRVSVQHPQSAAEGEGRFVFALKPGGKATAGRTGPTPEPGHETKRTPDPPDPREPSEPAETRMHLSAGGGGGLAEPTTVWHATGEAGLRHEVWTGRDHSLAVGATVGLSVLGRTSELADPSGRLYAGDHEIQGAVVLGAGLTSTHLRQAKTSVLLGLGAQALLGAPDIAWDLDRGMDVLWAFPLTVTARTNGEGPGTTLSVSLAPVLGDRLRYGFQNISGAVRRQDELAVSWVIGGALGLDFQIGGD